MTDVSIRDLRNNGAAVLGRVERGEELQVTRDGHPVARLSPLPRRALHAEELLARARSLPPLDLERFRADIDELIDQRW